MNESYFSVCRGRVGNESYLTNMNLISSHCPQIATVRNGHLSNMFVERDQATVLKFPETETERERERERSSLCPQIPTVRTWTFLKHVCRERVILLPQ